MAELSGAVSAPGFVHLFGEYSSLFGEPAVAFALDLRLTIKAEPAEFDFFIIDGFKLDQFKHPYLYLAVRKLWKGKPIEFNTSSQLPMVTGMGTRTALTVALTGLLLKFYTNGIKDENVKKKSLSTAKLARRGFALEHYLAPPVTPIGTTTIVTGGTILMYNIPAGAIWTIKDKTRAWYMHKINILKGLSIVIGFLKQPGSANYSATDPKPLFDSKIKPKWIAHSNKSTSNSKEGHESIPAKLMRFASKSGFAKDIITDLGKNTCAGMKALSNGDWMKVGDFMKEQQNLITILGIYPSELKELAEAAEEHSIGVAHTGTHGDAILALTKKPELVANNIRKAGGEAVITKMSERGFTFE